MEVPLHLLWCYAVLSVWVALFAIPILVIVAMSEQVLATLISSASAMVSALPFILGALHVWAFVRFRQYVLPRFPYAPALLTFVVAVLSGSLLLALAWTANRFSVRLLSEGWAGFNELSDVFARFSVAVVLALLGGVVGYMQRYTGQDGAPLLGIGAWMGRMIVGRDAYDAHIAKESARLKRDYDDHRQAIGRPT
jgi:hypothetical protein